MSATTSENFIPAELPVRIAARGIDAALLLVLDLGLGRLIGYGFDWLLLGTALVLAYFSLFDALLGATPGKLALGLRLVGPDSTRPSLRQSLLRETCTIVGAVPFVGPLIALVVWTRLARMIRSNPLRQGKHDLLAGGTRVIKARSPAIP